MKNLPTQQAIEETHSIADAQRIIEGAIQQERARPGSKNLNLGCGQHPILGVTNVDLHSDDADVKEDITNLKSFQPESIDMIEAHHVIEHLDLRSVLQSLKAWNHLLKPEGLLVITCPDLEAVFQEWKKSDRTIDSYELKMIYGSQEHEGMFHKSGFCSQSLPKVLAECNYVSRLVYSPYPDRTTPSLLVIAQKKG